MEHHKGEKKRDWLCVKTTTSFSKAQRFIEAKLQQVDGIRKHQLKFLSTLLEVMWTVPHRIHFLNMSRFSLLGEQTFRLQFMKEFDFLGLFISMSDNFWKVLKLSKSLNHQ